MSEIITGIVDVPVELSNGSTVYITVQCLPPGIFRIDISQDLILEGDIEIIGEALSKFPQNLLKQTPVDVKQNGGAYYVDQDQEEHSQRRSLLAPEEEVG